MERSKKYTRSRVTRAFASVRIARLIFLCKNETRTTITTLGRGKIRDSKNERKTTCIVLPTRLKQYSGRNTRSRCVVRKTDAAECRRTRVITRRREYFFFYLFFTNVL